MQRRICKYTHTDTHCRLASFSLLPRHVAQCVNSQLQHRALFLCCINWCVLVIFFFHLCVFYQRCTVVVVVVGGGVVGVVAASLISAKLPHHLPLCSPPLLSSFASLQGWCDLRLCLKTEDWGCYLPVIDASCNSHCPHTLQADGARERDRETEDHCSGRMGGWKEGRKQWGDNAGRLMGSPRNVHT